MSKLKLKKMASYSSVDKLLSYSTFSFIHYSTVLPFNELDASSTTNRILMNITTKSARIGQISLVPNSKFLRPKVFRIFGHYQVLMEG